MAQDPAPQLNWWLKDLQSPRHEVAQTALNTLRTLQSSRMAAGLFYESLYEQKNAYMSDSGSFQGDMGVGFGFMSQTEEIGLLTYNAMQIGFDTLVSKLMQADPRVVCQTDNASFETRKKAELLERIIFSEFNKLDFYDVKEEISLDMLLFGFGEMRFDIDEYNKCPIIRRVHPLDIWYDVLEARDNPPITRYETRLCAKDVLKETYPKIDPALIDAAHVSGDRTIYSGRGMNPDNMVEVIEAIRIPAFPGADPGMYLRFISTATLETEEWNRDFPVVRMHWTKRRRGPYPIPAAEQIVWLQRNLNRLIERKHECIYTLATPRIILDEHTGVPPSHFQTSGVSDIIVGDFTGRPQPTIMNPSVVPQDIEAAIQQDKIDIANILGINSLESVGTKPAGLDSQPGLAEYTDQAGLRHYKTLKENERFVMKAAKKLLETLRECSEAWGYKVLTEAMGEYETIDFSDADLPPDELRINLAPANMLPATPAGRLNRITQLAGTGAFQPKQIMRMFQSPDIMSAINDATASEQETEWTIYEMTKENGQYLAPTEHSDLTLGLEHMNAAYQRCRRQGYPDAVLGRLDRWMAEALLLQQRQQAVLMAQQVQAQQMAAQQQAGAQAAQSMGGTTGGAAPQGPSGPGSPSSSTPPTPGAM